MTQVRPSTGTPDQKESLQITAREGSMDGRWPRTEGFEPLVRSVRDAAAAELASVTLDQQLSVEQFVKSMEAFDE